jgi:hypothetical protein
MATKRRFSKRSKNNQFVIRVVDAQHSTWQGEITCLGTKEKQHFRSALELLCLINSGIGMPVQAEKEATVQ